MAEWQALVLGIIQGLTEFFPVSSSAHLLLAQHFMGISESYSLLLFNLLCHLGSLGALVWYLRKEIVLVLLDPPKMARFFLALIPLVPFYLLLHPLKLFLQTGPLIGPFLMVTAGLLFLATKSPLASINYARPKYLHVLCIGLMQAVALFPGISRSGSTICVARYFGWSWVEGAKFSFLLALPAICGGSVLEGLKIWQQSSEPLFSLSSYLLGMIASFLFGLIGVRAIFYLYRKGNVAPCIWYCLMAGLFAWWVFHGQN